MRADTADSALEVMLARSGARIQEVNRNNEVPGQLDHRLLCRLRSIEIERGDGKDVND